MSKKKTDKMKEAEDRFNFRLFEQELERRLGDYEEHKAEFVKRVQEHPREAIRWASEEMVKQHRKAQEMKSILTAWHEWGSEEPKRFLDTLKEEMEDLKKVLITRPYSHDSTSLMSNACRGWEKEAISDLVAGTIGGGFYRSIIKALEKILDNK